MWRARSRLAPFLTRCRSALAYEEIKATVESAVTRLRRAPLGALSASGRDADRTGDPWPLWGRTKLARLAQFLVSPRIFFFRRSLSKSLATAAADISQKNWELMLVDLRNHGGSAAIQSFDPPHSILSAAQDLIHLCEHTNKWPVFVSGHSMGGKVALEYLRLLQSDADAPCKLPKHVWILDSQLGPVTSLPANREVDRIIQTIQAIPLPIPSRKWLYSHIREEKGMSLQVAHWLGSNLEGHPNGPMQWIFNADGAADILHGSRQSNCWDVVKHPPKGTSIHIVRAAQSERWNPELIHELHSTVETTQERAKVYVLENAGHWLHADNPEGLLKLLMPSLVQI